MQNLIAGDGPHAVLLKEGARKINFKGIYGDSLYSQHLKDFKTEIQQKCSPNNLVTGTPTMSEKEALEFHKPYQQCVQKNCPADYINYSMYLIDPKKLNADIYLHHLPQELKQDFMMRIRRVLKKKPKEPLTKKEIMIYLEQHILPERREKIKKYYQEEYNAFAYYNSCATLVQSAGNDYQFNPQVYQTVVRKSKNLNSIIVGSLTPDGYRSDFSQANEEVTIMAPSDHSIITKDYSEKLKEFSGTSGAAPLVTGSLAAFNYMSDYRPTAKLAKILLRNTAIPTRYSNNQPQKNGAGMVNAYKLGLLGKKLKGECKNAKNRQACFESKIKDPATYKFPEDVHLPKTLERVFPECSRSVCADLNATGSSDCQEKKAVLKRLRQQAFLHPKKAEYGRYLSCIYAGYGFKETSSATIKAYISNADSKYNNQLNSNKSYCRTSADCVLVPKCSNWFIQKTAPAGFLAFNKSMAEVYYNTRYYSECRNKPKCHQKCRCDDLEIQKKGEEVDPKTGKKTIHWEHFSAKCVNARCELRTKVKTAEVEGSAEGTKKPAVSPTVDHFGKGAESPKASSGSIQ